MAAMSYRSLADFLEELSAHGELERVAVEVDPALEVAEITRRVAAGGGPALLFERVRGASMAVVTNLLGTEARVCRALAIESLDEIPLRCEALIQKNTPQNWFDRLKTLPEDVGANKFRARLAKSGPCQQVVRLGRDVDLATFPLIKQWSAELAPAITAGQLISQGQDSQQRGVTLCSLQSAGPNALAVLDDGHSSFARHWARHREAGEKMPAAMVVGGDPAALIAASLEVPDDADAYHVTGLLRGAPVELVKCRTHAIEVPADADLVFEGYLDPEGPLADVVAAAAGGSYYRRALPAPVLHVTAVTHRSHALFPAIVDSGSHGDHAALLAARERMLLPAVRNVAPDVVDLHLPTYGGPHRYAFVSVHKRYPFQSRQIASALWGSDALRFVKFLILVDPHVNVHDATAVFAAVGANVAPERDVFSYDGPAHGSDHAQHLDRLSRHLAFDATAKLPTEQAGPWPAPLATSEEIRRLVTERWEEYRLKSPR
jgi:4-hydroxy-3-polyprenylbenzoate decarboxylase